MESKKSGIYQVTCVINNKIYIGSAKNLRNRKMSHLYALRANNHHSPPFQNAFNKYGEENFVFKILEIVESEANLLEREQHYLDTLNPQYNICRVAGNCLGVKHSEETKKKQSDIKKGKKQSKELIEKRFKNIIGQKRSDDTKKKMSLSAMGKNLGKKHSKESIEKAIASRAGYAHSEETKQKISEGHKGKKFSEETKKKMAENNARKGKPGTFLGKSHSEESRLKNSESQKNMVKKTCIHCGKEASPSKIARWHNDNCLKNPEVDLEKQEQKRTVSKELREKRGQGVREARNKEEVKEKFRVAFSNRPLITCPHCNHSAYNKGAMINAHFDNCKKNPDFDVEAHNKKKEEIRVKRKLALQDRPLITCPHCSKSSYNKGNMVLNHFDNCKTITSIIRKRDPSVIENMKLAWVERKARTN